MLEGAAQAVTNGCLRHHRADGERQYEGCRQCGQCMLLSWVAGGVAADGLLHGTVALLLPGQLSAQLKATLKALQNALCES